MPLADLGDIQLNYQIHGDGPPVLGIMGFALDQRYWATTTPAVAQTHSFITFDNRGTGGSSKIPASSIDQMADDAFRLLEFLKIDKAVVFGVSMGGTIAQRFALDHPDRLSALILGITWGRPIEFMRRQHEVARKILAAGGPSDLVEISMLRMFTPRFFEVGQDAIDRMLRSFFVDDVDEDMEGEVLKAQLDALDKHDVLNDLTTISVPTLVFGGKMDMMVPGFASDELANAIPGAELTMFETGHGCMVEEMQAVNERVSRFLATL
jgi:aminoacrylate hydrolase